MAAYLSEQLPHLRDLHFQLGLPPETIAADEQSIETAIRQCVENLVNEYEDQVNQHKVKLHRMRLDVADLVRAIGRQARSLQVSSEERLKEVVRHPRSVHDRKPDLPVSTSTSEYDGDPQRRVGPTLRDKMASLAHLLGPPVEPLPPPRPISVFSKDTGRRDSASLARMQAMTPPRRTSILQPGLPPDTGCWFDVSDDAMAAAEAAIQQALEEREAKLDHLKTLIVNLAFLHRELVLPEFPAEGRDRFPNKLLPRRSDHAVSYQKLIASVLAQNPLPEDEEDDDEEGMVVIGMEIVEPEQGLLEWTESLNELWTEEKDRRQNRIQELYNQVEPLWIRLEMEQDAMDLFIEMNRGCGEAVIEAYEVEVDRCLQLRRNSLEKFINAVRTEIEILWDELMMSEEDKGDFGPFIDDVYTEELLQAHEEEIERLRAEIESKTAILPKVREWHTLCKDEAELERMSHDPNRFSARGGALLKEEKLRKRVNMLKPKLEMDMLSLLPTWEAEHGRPFTVSGQRVVDRIHDALEAKEQAKLAKKATRAGLAPAKTISRSVPASVARHTTPAAVPGSTRSMSRKREAPTPTPYGSSNNPKRPRVGTQGSTMKPRPIRGFPEQGSSPSRPPAGRSLYPYLYPEFQVGLIPRHWLPKGRKR
ncbi:hypothetical protein TREMEDRAFT_62739 [Tremella mesenterica DSM 1558]|uniref:uncharacterized protein n=1 Tax=Tremella mesenterica (strain ATCC 24925 / CBS 8224 / DSM 1558 / NBRC 9311 / NRRL Y-6157 / RJB 2259-6 / UBC 559-6) TaxID=578456 RepID=UPI0003F48C4D|nr:uncharacterized protein TREMEDRAFT_62739 [Tremella mesenterica DSM 1558]EIW69021.1 hypothetical protein TREMEDRAFT_62739 [Tremella mesenterica DSM 1558]